MATPEEDVILYMFRKQKPLKIVFSWTTTLNALIFGMKYP